MRNILLFFGALVTFGSCKQPNSKAIERTEQVVTGYYQEPFRPQVHFSPKEKWMNDPNGLVYHNGTYHLFYQYYPDDIVWGPMHWGHATSRDMVHWNHHPIALYPDDLGLIFSGSAVVDENNTSGFGTDTNPPLVAMFTYHNMEREKSGALDYQTQGIAYSLDNGMTWEKYKGNPVIGNTDIKDFRDPKVFWDDVNEQWVLVLVAGDHAKFYRSSNLKDWDYMSDFGKDHGAHGGVWECPDLFPLTVEETGETKWVLLISINPGAPNGGSGTQYFVGDFDGTSFTTDQQETCWLDWGRDNYAGVTYNNVPGNQRIFIGWMSNWNYARDTPTEVWRSSMTLPRKLSLTKSGASYYLKNYPLSTLNNLRTVVDGPQEFTLEEERILPIGDSNAKEIIFKTNLGKALQMHIGNPDEKVTLALNPEEGKLFFDRRHSGQIDFETSFADGIQEQPYTPEDKLVEVRIIMDSSSIEFFLDEGRYVFTNQIFPNEPYDQIKMVGAAQTISDYYLYNLKTIWNEQ